MAEAEQERLAWQGQAVAMPLELEGLVEAHAESQPGRSALRVELAVEEAQATERCRMLGLGKASTSRRQTTSTLVSEETSTSCGRGEILLASFAFPFSCC